MLYNTSIEKKKALNAAFDLGRKDETYKFIHKLTGREIIEVLEITGYKYGDVPFLKSAYSAGRFHVETMGECGV